MIKSFSNILVPVDFSDNTEIAVRKVIELAEPTTKIHLLHVKKAGALPVFSRLKFFASKEHLLPSKEIEPRLKLWKDYLSDNNIKNVYSYIVDGNNVQQVIIETAKKIPADLIIIGKSSDHSWLPALNTVIPGRLSATLDINVLTVKPGKNYIKARTMIVPVSDGGAINKLDIIYAISKKFPVHIHLLAFTGSGEKRDKSYSTTLLELYQTLQTTINNCVEYRVLQGNNKAKEILKYADAQNADIILVNPGTETRIGWPNKHISDVLHAESKLQVWTM